MSVAHWFALGAAVCAVLAWLAARRPTVLLWLVLATFALGPHWILADRASPALLAWAMPAQMLLLVAALLANAVRYGVRLDVVNWPLLAALWLLVQTMALSALDPAITAPALLAAALSLALPWCLVHVALQPGSRVYYALLIALLPALCVLAGGALELLDVHPLFSGSKGRGARLQGASNAGWLAFLAFIGFAIAVHEAMRRRSIYFGSLAALNAVIAMLSGGRMGLAACGIVAATYALLMPAPRPRAALLGLLAVIASGGVLAVVQLSLHGLIENPDRLLDLNGRERIWLDYFDQFLAAPLFGRGLGAAEHVASYHDLPHNEYLRLLVDGGLIGAASFGAAVLVWAWRVLDLIRPGERAFVWALFLALGVYALTANVLIMPAGILPFLYLAIMRIPSARWVRHRTRRRASGTGPSAAPAPLA
jgi:O-antigen ligase